MFVEDAEQVDRGLNTLMPEGLGEIVRCFLCGCRGFLFDEVDLNVEVTDGSCGAAELFQEAASLFFRLPV